jgi:hypothetical protein
MFMDRDCPWTIETSESPIDALYDGCAGLVQTYVERSPNPLKTILEPNVRAQLQEEALPLLLRQYHDAMVQKNETETVDIKMIATIFPSFKQLELGVTKERLISAFRGMGAKGFADDLATQDLGKLIDTYVSYGFPRAQ